MNRSDTRKQVTPGFAGMRKDDDGDYDETDSGGFGKVDMPQQAARAFGMKADKMDELDEGDEEDDEVSEGPVPVRNAPGHAKGDAMTNRADQDAEEASEMRQKGGNMGTKGMKAGGGKIQGQEISDSDEMKGSSTKVIHGREKPSGHEAEIEGSFEGSGRGSEPPHWSNLGHGEREATISGAHQGQHGGSMMGEGFEAGGRLSKESARGPRGTKR